MPCGGSDGEREGRERGVEGGERRDEEGGEERKREKLVLAETLCSPPTPMVGCASVKLNDCTAVGARHWHKSEL